MAGESKGTSLGNRALDEDVHYHRHEPRDCRGTDHTACTLWALRNQAEEHNGSKEGENTAANVFPADPDYRGIDVEARCPRGIEQEVPGDPAYERGDARDQEATSEASPRPGGEGGGGEHPGYDGRHVRYRYTVHKRFSVSCAASRTRLLLLSLYFSLYAHM